MRSDTLRVPGANLYYEVRGTGPLVLMIPGGGSDAANADGLAEVLRQHFTVVAYDVRGYSRSRLDGGRPEPQHVAVQSEDALRLIDHLSDEPAFVVGGSNGAIVGLDLLARHSDRVRLLIAHEPPCFGLLPDAAEHRAMTEEVATLVRTQGVEAAGARFMRAIGGAMGATPAASELSPRAAEMWTRLAANAPIMMEYELREFTSYTPDFDVLKRVSDRLIIAAGRNSRGHLPYRPAAEIAARLDLPVTEFPGGHNGSRTHAEEFAQQLLGLLTTQLA
ncbi:alpha/beta hydrolase [Nocardia transvalensis]|uniref:alpha/beta hydrolase n=1 Tax=Nocardia transvalensis TaxID=37333 RepID=UPI00189612B5|nr:alpha/beta hydrolase [Nocardia transvalensis]MBF6328132.1 alpha/beta hydrolase [Nocardia transvalensis]